MAIIVPADEAGRDNMLQLVQLRWIAVAGQLVAIWLTQFALGVVLPQIAMLGVLSGVVGVNIICLLLLKWRQRVTNTELFVTMLVDVLALSAQLYLSGGATNPFVSLFLLQVVIGSVLLERWSTWAMVGAATLAFAVLTIVYRPIELPPAFHGTLFALHVQGTWVCFVLIAILLVQFVTRINGNLRTRDTHLADLRRQAVEEDHIVRIGLLASGAAHELGTPLSSLSVILGDWRRNPRITRHEDLAQDVAEMQDEVQRCKAIVTSILLSAGEARGEASTATSVRTFLDGVIADWRTARGHACANYVDDFGPDVPIVSDIVLQQVVFNLLDNAAEASPDWIGIRLTREDDALVLVVADRGSGFPADILAAIGTPYTSTKPKAGAGLGLFLVTNVMRKLGGTVTAANRAEGGAAVTLHLPLAMVALVEDDHG